LKKQAAIFSYVTDQLCHAFIEKSSLNVKRLDFNIIYANYALLTWSCFVVFRFLTSAANTWVKSGTVQYV